MMDMAKLTPRHITWTLRAFRAPFSAGLATATEARRAMTAKKRIVICGVREFEEIKGYYCWRAFVITSGSLVVSLQANEIIR